MAFAAIAIEGERELSWGELRARGVSEDILALLAVGPVEQAAEALATLGLGLTAIENPYLGYHPGVMDAMPDESLVTDKGWL